jgi:hypothetical protein
VYVTLLFQATYKLDRSFESNGGDGYLCCLMKVRVLLSIKSHYLSEWHLKNVCVRTKPKLESVSSDSGKGTSYE